MIGVLIIPTGVGAEIGGHAGDGNPVAKLVASCCDMLITHPNVVNAADINEMTENTLYVEGSMLDRFLRGEIALQRVRSNKVLVAVNPPLRPETVNAVSAARVTIGLDAEMVVLKTPLKMIVKFADNGTASGVVSGWEELVEQVSGHEFDALAIISPIDVSNETAVRYLREGGVNPWGGVEAKVSKLIAMALNKPVAHAPMENNALRDFSEVVDPRMAPELVSICYAHSVLKGLHRAPRVGKTGLRVEDVDFLMTPVGCVGPPHHACMEHGVPIIAVRENKTCLDDPMPDCFMQVENYFEAVGVALAIKAGVSLESVRRPVKFTQVVREEVLAGVS